VKADDEKAIENAAEGNNLKSERSGMASKPSSFRAMRARRHW